MISTVADFDALLKVCRAHKVSALRLGDIEVSLGEVQAPRTDSGLSAAKPIDIDFLAHQTYSTL